MYTIPFDVSLIGIFPHMHYLGKNWEVYIENPDGSKTNLIKINDWDFNWQGGYYFDRYKIAKKGSKVHAFAKYDNSTGNPANPSNPPRFVTWGEGTKDEMYYLPLLFVPYKVGDENVVFENNTSSLYDLESTNIKAKIYPNPISVQQTYPAHVQFQLHTGTTVSMEIYNEAGQMVRTLFKNEYFSEGDHIVHVETSRAVKGKYFVKITTKNDAVTLPVLVVE
ncbi:MAG: T9SS type A sorting domain-containing protein [Saprospiraceae bacterium]|nr:T9SS type A sorting domain-containing protein [Saprospiraceae bacterium]